MLTERVVDGDLTTATFTVAGAAYDVVGAHHPRPGHRSRLTCKAGRDNPVPAHELLDVRRLPLQ